MIDHSVQVDFARSGDAQSKNETLEFQRNKERFKFLKWGAGAFSNMLIIPPGSGIVHQVNLEYLARVCFVDKKNENMVYPDSVNDYNTGCFTKDFICLSFFIKALGYYPSNQTCLFVSGCWN